ncbi:MAG TPA: hypothetical protein VHE12_08080 [bacterium]|nr:hypothetical protein [bacterium]
MVATLPFVEIGDKDFIDFGDVIFWRGSSYKEFLPAESHQLFIKYVEHHGTFIAFEAGTNNKFITKKQLPQNITCISVSKRYFALLSEAKLKDFVYDAIYLLYFFSNFHKFRLHSSECLNPFLKIFPAGKSYLDSENAWSLQFNFESQTEDPVKITVPPYSEELFQAGGKLLARKYFSENPKFSARAINSVRFFSNGFFDKFRQPRKYYFSNPEDTAALAACFESLFDLHQDDEDKSGTVAKFKNRLIRLFSLEDDEIPRAILTSWANGFYNLRSRIIHGDESFNFSFRDNPNFEISHIQLAINIFLVSIYYELIGFGFIEPRLSGDSWLKKDFLVYFWPQKELLVSILSCLKKLANADYQKISFEIEKLYQLIDWYCDIYGEVDSFRPGVKFIETPKKDLDLIIPQIEKLLNNTISISNKTIPIKEIYPSRANQFILVLRSY